ncbi:hypothetical protein JCM1841_002222 [Sporobolomyces salmonicolor]
MAEMTADWALLKAKRAAKLGPPAPSSSSPSASAPVRYPRESGGEGKQVDVPPPEEPSVAQNPFFSHPDLPASLGVRLLPGRDRGVVAQQETPIPGTTLLSTAPLVSVLDNRNLFERCSACFRTAEDTVSHRPLQQCSLCHVVQYCSSTCQHSDWPLHKRECSALRAASKTNAGSSRSAKPVVPDTPVRALGRLLWKCESAGPNLWKQVESLQSHRRELSQEEQERFFQLSMALASYVGQETLTAACPNGGALLDLCSRFTHNSFALTSSTDMTNIGVSISPLTALFNHSCSPNAVVVFPSFPSSSWPKHMRVVTLKPISPGEEVLTSYVDIALPRELRRKELKDRYKFDCDCVECTGKVREGKVDPREALSCPTAGCEGLIARPGSSAHVDAACSACGAATTLQDSSAALQAAKVALGDAEKAQYDDPRTALIHLSHLISSLTSISPPFAPSSYPLLHAYQLQLTLQLHAHDFPSALQSAHFAWQGATLIYHFGHPVRAVLSTTVARLAVMAPSSESSSPEADLAYWSNLGQRARGVAMLVEALKEVEVAFGKVEGGGEMGKAVRELLRDQEEGMAMARKVGRAMRGV